jgi:hypothetical protein
MNSKIFITTKNGSTVSVPLSRLRSPRAVLLFTLDSLSKSGNRNEIIQMIKKQGERLGLELNAYEVRPPAQEDKV